MQKPLIVLDKGRVRRNPKSEGILLLSVINESYTTDPTKNQTTQSKIPRILSNFETIPVERKGIKMSSSKSLLELFFSSL